ncbi:MAG TPA: hypothetical protein H9799_01660 [Candidatus Mediterraneibacter merdipullorum]|nr:hypothetical protein [Candidatus Mediterraneibacter merdipullorum]
MIRRIGLIAGQNFSGWHKNARIWMTFALALVLCLMLSDQMLTRAQTYDASIQVFEPYIWTFGDSGSVLLSTVLLLVLFADMPFIDQATPYRLARTTRNIWLAGQVVYVVFSVTLYHLFLLLVESLLAMPWAYTGNVWSRTSAAFAYGGDGKVPVSLKTMEMSTPYACAAAVFLLMLLYSLFVASLMLLINLTAGNAAGVVGVLLINLYGYLLDAELIRRIFDIPAEVLYRANVLCGWLSPLRHATFPMHDFGYDYLPGLHVSVGLFLLLNTVFLALSGRRMRKYDFSFVQVGEGER